MAESVFVGETVVRASDTAYDWLGHGVYFWDSNPSRARDYARMLATHPRGGRGRIKNPAVIGAMIDLGFCLNLLDGSPLKIVRAAYEQLEEVTSAAQLTLPENRAVGDSTDLLLRHLDCAVIEYLHTTRKDQRKRKFDSVRGVFVEGKLLYPNAGFNEYITTFRCACARQNASWDTLDRKRCERDFDVHNPYNPATRSSISFSHASQPTPLASRQFRANAGMEDERVKSKG